MSRKRIFEIMDYGDRKDTVSKVFNVLIIALIFANVTAVAMETVESFAAQFSAELYWFEVFSVAVFSVEYVLRIWTCVESKEDSRFTPPVSGRLRYALTPMAIIDLLAVLPFFLSMFLAIDLRFLRVFRLLRVLKLTRYSGAMDTLMKVFKNERKQLFAAISIMVTLLVFLSGIVYFIEKDAQPEAFASIFHAMWWGMATLTTVGYGDVVPHTPLGKIIGSVVTVAGLGMFALPAAILASGFTREAKGRDFLATWKMVAKVPLFSKLNAIEIAEISELLTPRIAAPGEELMHKGDKGTDMFFIVSGEVNVDIGHEPHILGRGGYFGEVALLYKTGRIATVTAITSCQFLTLAREDFHELLAEHEDLHDEIMAVAKERMTAADS